MRESAVTFKVYVEHDDDAQISAIHAAAVKHVKDMPELEDGYTLAEVIDVERLT